MPGESDWPESAASAKVHQDRFPLPRVPELERVLCHRHGTEQRGREPAEPDVGAAAGKSEAHLRGIRNAHRPITESSAVPRGCVQGAATAGTFHATPAEGYYLLP